jgi:XTP/dITP diphosphohydrolase
MVPTNFPPPSNSIATSLLIASTNAGKIREFRQMLSATGIQFTDLSAFKNLPTVEETGRTFLANACIKATAYALATKHWTLADDSGLCVDAINGKPGVHSARWAALNNAGTGDAANNHLLLEQLANIPDSNRTARFICSLALSDPQGRIILTASGSVEGRILHAPRGSAGFGYDPLFEIITLGKTTAELPSDQKHQISHRGQALRRLHELMKRTMP